MLCTTTGGGGRERAGDAAPEGEEEDNIVTTIDEVCVSLAANVMGTATHIPECFTRFQIHMCAEYN